jgi:hypothetical protein
MTTSTSLSITFGEESETSEISQTYSLEVDSDYFETVNGESKTTYFPTDEVFLKCIPPSSVEAYSLHSSIGTLTKTHSDVLFEVTETISFKKSSTASLGSIPYSIVSHSWIGADKGSVSFSGGTATVSSEIVGLLEVTYMVKGDRLSLTGCSSEQDVFEALCLDEYTEERTDTTVSFEQSEGEEGEQIVSVKFTVKDAVTDSKIPDASVTISGNGFNETQISNENGEVVFSGLIRGNTYDIETVASGYYSSGEDYLNNDSFTVPTE